MVALGNVPGTTAVQVPLWEHVRQMLMGEQDVSMKGQNPRVESEEHAK
jgi:hypothetical protein